MDANNFPLHSLAQLVLVLVFFSSWNDKIWCLFDKCVFCEHNIAGINGPKLYLLNHCWRLLISGGVYKSTGDNYWSTMSFTNPCCHLPIRRCQLLIRRKNKMLKTDPKKAPAKILFARSYKYKFWCLYSFCIRIYSYYNKKCDTKDS